MHGKVLFPEQLDPRENRFNNDYFDRSVWFMEDLLSGNIIAFCSRYLGLPDYEEMYDLIIEYFTKHTNPMGVLRYFDTLRGKRIMTQSIINTEKRVMTRAVDNTKKRSMITIQERMPRNDNN